jgi:hypothetical protein
MGFGTYFKENEMDKLILGVLLLIGASANAAIPGTSNSVGSGMSATINTAAGNNPFTIPLASLSTIAQICASGGGTSTHYYGFYSAAAPSYGGSYQVPSGKSFYALVVDYVMAAAGNTEYFGYGSGPLGSDGSASGPPGIVSYTGAAGAAGLASQGAGAGSKSGIGLVFPALSYPFVNWVGSTGNAANTCLIGVVQ